MDFNGRALGVVVKLVVLVAGRASSSASALSCGIIQRGGAAQAADSRMVSPFFDVLGYFFYLGEEVAMVLGHGGIRSWPDLAATSSHRRLPRRYRRQRSRKDAHLASWLANSYLKTVSR